MKNRKNALMVMMILLIMTFMFISTKEVSAKVRFNKSSKTVTKGKSYTLKITGVKLKKIKKVTLKYNKKIVKVKRLKKNSYRVVGRKKGKTTLRAAIKYRKLDNSKGIKRLKCKISVKNKNTKKDRETYDKTNTDNNSSGIIEDDADYGQSIDKFLSNNKSKDIYKINDFTLYNGYIEDTPYGIIVNPLYHDIDFYSKKEYDEIISETDRIVKECKISDDMTDEEKVFRLGRYLIKNIDYVVGCNIYKIHDALFKKKTVCAGYSTTFAFLCRYIGIDCDYVYTEGYFIDDYNMNHAWNNIKMGDYYYRIDITKSYALRNDGWGSAFFKVDDTLSENYKKYLASYFKSEEYKETHNIDTVEYYLRCEIEGVKSLTSKELHDLLE